MNSYELFSKLRNCQIKVFLSLFYFAIFIQGLKNLRSVVHLMVKFEYFNYYPYPVQMQTLNNFLTLKETEWQVIEKGK